MKPANIALLALLALMLLLIIIFWPALEHVKPSRVLLPPKLVDQYNNARFNKTLSGFLEACEREAEEIAPFHPFPVKHLYVYDDTKNVNGMWEHKIFEDYRQSIEASRTQKDVSVISRLADATPGPGNYILKRAVIEETTVGQRTYRGVRQEFIDTMTNKVKASRTNYYLGNDFARGVSCLDHWWREGFNSFISRSIGFMPGHPRSDAWL